MVNLSSVSLDRVLHALSDPTRRAILAHVSRGEQTVGAIAQPHDMSLPAISKHLRVLENARLIVRRKEGRQSHVRLNPQPFDEVTALLEYYRTFWNQQLDSLERFINSTSKPTKRK